MTWVSPIDEPTLGEVLRRIDSLTQQVTQLVTELKQDRADAARTYVRQDVYMANRTAEAAVVADLHGDVARVEAKTNERFERIEAQQKADAASRRQVWLTVIGLMVTAVLGVAALVLNIVQG